MVLKRLSIHSKMDNRFKIFYLVDLMTNFLFISNSLQLFNDKARGYRVRLTIDG